MGERGFLLDCDGMLIDSIGAWHEAEVELLEEVGETMSKEQRDEVNALTLEEASVYFHERFGVRESPEAVMQAILQYLMGFYRTRSEARPGALELVRALHDAGATTCVLSSSPQEFLQVGLQRAGLLPYIDRAISVEDLNTTKRDVETYRHVCELMGLSLSESWLLDDSWYALKTAREAGMRTLGVYSADGCGTHEELNRYSERVVDSLTELSAAELLA